MHHPGLPRFASTATLASLVLAASLTSSAAQEVAIHEISTNAIVMRVLPVGGSRSVAVATKRGLVLIDTGPFPLVGKMLRKAAERHFGRQDWAFVINTHGHDHVGGSSAFGDIPFIAHDNLTGELETHWLPRVSTRAERAKLAAYSRQRIAELEKGSGDTNAPEREAQIALWRAIEQEILEGFDVVLPTLTFSTNLTLRMDDRTVRMAWVGKGHTTADIVVFIPEDGTLVTGGACSSDFPRIRDSSSLDDLRRWIDVFDTVLDAGVQHVVSGHGEPEVAAVRRTHDYYKDLLAAAERAHQRGLSLDQAQARLSLDDHFPNMRATRAYGSTPEEIHRANVALLWGLLSRE